MTRRLAALLLGITLGNTALACRCLEPAAGAAAERAELIVAGRILERAPLHDGDGELAILEVERHWKDAATQRIPVVSGTSCTMVWQAGQRYLLYLFREDNGLYATTRCDGNLPLSQARDRIPTLDKRYP